MLDQLLEDVRGGASRALVVHGEAGMGKTALLEYVAGRASDFRVVSVAAAQAEMEFGFAALHQLCLPLLDHLDAVPAPQRKALYVTFGLGVGPVPDRFLVGLAVLSLLAEVAAERPLVCLIDDEQWLDQASAQVLAFVARRLGTESVGLVFGARTPSAELAGLPELVVGGLADDDARVLLGSVLTGPVEARVRDRIVAEAGGNPLALLELPRSLTAAELAGGFGMPGASALPGSVEESFLRRADALPPEARRLLLVAAAEHLSDPVLVWRAAALLGIGADAAGPAADAGLAEIGARVRFRHPLVRSAVYRAASVQERQRVHGALAEATDPETDPDHRAWHLGHAAPGPDEGVASELERSAGRAQARAGLAAGAAFLDRAATLTPDPARRSGRALAAAQASLHAGAPDRAIALLDLAEAGPYDPDQRAEVDLLRAQVSFTVTRGGDSVSLLLNAARRLEPVNPRLARETYLDALMAAMFAGHLAVGDGLTEAARAARAVQMPQDQLPADLLLHGLAVRFTDGYTAAMPLLRRAVTAFNQREIPPEQLRWLWLAHIVAGHLWDEQTLDTIHHVDMARDSGALATLPLALATRMGAHVLMGDLPAAAVLLEAVNAVTESTGIPSAPYGALLLAAWQGRESEVVALVQATTAEALRRREGFGLIITGFAEAMLGNSLRRYEEAARAAEMARGYPAAMGVEPWGVLVELVEGATRSGQSVLANRCLSGSSRHDTGRRVGLGLGHGSQESCLTERWRQGRGRLQGGDRPAGPDANPRGAGPCTSPVRRMAATREAARRGAEPTSRGSQHVCRNGDGRLCGASSQRTPCHRRDGPEAQPCDPQSADRPGDPGRPAGQRGAVQPRNRHPPVHQCTHRPVSLEQGLHQNEPHLAQPVVPSAGRRTGGGQTSGVEFLGL